jgi:hypothetical protein
MRFQHAISHPCGPDVFQTAQAPSFGRSEQLDEGFPFPELPTPIAVSTKPVFNGLLSWPVGGSQN